MSSSPYTKENVRTGIFHYLLGRGASGVASFFSVILLVRHMSVAHYAAYTALMGLGMLATLLSGLGLDRAITRYVPEGRLKHASAALIRFVWLTAGVRLAAVLLVLALMLLAWSQVLHLFPAIGLDAFPIGLAFYLMAASLFQHFSTVLQALVQQKLLTRLMMFQWGGRFALICLFVLTQADISVDQSILVMAVPEMLGMLAMTLALHRHFVQLRAGESMPARDGHWPPWREVYALALHNHGYNLLAAPPQGYFMRLFAAALLPVQFVAAYGFFLSLGERVRQYLPLQMMFNLAEPILMAGYVQDRNFDKLAERTQLLYKLNLFFLAPAMVWLAFSAPALVNVITGGKYGELAWILLLVVAQMAIGSHALIVQLLLNAVGESKLLLRSGTGAMLLMCATLVAIYLHGTMSYLIFAPLVYEFSNNALALWQLGRKGHAYRIPLRFVAHVALASAVGGIACFLGGLPGMPALLSLIVTAALCAVGFLATLWMSGAITPSEIQIMKSIFKKKSIAVETK